MDIAPDAYVFKRAEDLTKGDKYIMNDKIYTVIDIKYLVCKANVHHRVRHVTFTLQCDEDDTITKKSFRIGYGSSMSYNNRFFY